MTKQETLQWRELEALYCSLEFGFINVSTIAISITYINHMYKLY